MKKKILLIAAAAALAVLAVIAATGWQRGAMNQQQPPPPPTGLHGKPMGPPPGGINGQPPGKPPGAGTGKREGTVSPHGISLTKNSENVSSKVFTSDGEDEVAVKVSGGKLMMKDCRIEKTGADSKEGDGTSFFGINSGVLATGDGQIIMNGGNITTNAVGANGIVAYGGKVIANNVTIDCKKNLSRGIHATGGGTIIANDLNITTAGNNSSVIATDRGGGTVTVTRGSYHAKGKDCAVCYSTGKIIVSDIDGTSEIGEIGVVEGDNELLITNCRMTSGDKRRGMLILQSGSGDAEGFHGIIKVTGGSLKTHKKAPLLEVATSTEGSLELCDVSLDVPSGVLMLVDYNRSWNTSNPVGHLYLRTAKQASYSGNVVLDEYGTATVEVGKGVTWNGAIDNKDKGKSTAVNVLGTWNLTADSYVDTLTLQQGATVNRGGHRLTYKTLTNNGNIN